MKSAQKLRKHFALFLWDIPTLWDRNNMTREELTAPPCRWKVPNSSDNFPLIYSDSMIRCSGVIPQGKSCLSWPLPPVGPAATEGPTTFFLMLSFRSVYTKLEARAVDPDPLGSAFIFSPGSGSRREKFKNNNRKKCKEIGNNHKFNKN